MKVSEQYPKLPPIDFEGIRKRVKLHEYVERDLGEPKRGRRWVCPFHTGAEGANFSVKDEVWSCFVCGARGDIISYVAKRDGISIVDAACKLDPSLAAARSKENRAKPRPPAAPQKLAEPKPERRPAPPAVWQDPAWQAALDAIVCEAEAALWAPSGRPVLDWLRARGLRDHTIRRFRLGFVPRSVESKPLEVLGTDRGGGVGRIWIPRGVTLPWAHPEGCYGRLDDPEGPRWVGCQVRRLGPDPWGETPEKKYLAPAGSERGHAYPFAHAVAGLPALICEGEFDTLLAWQEVGALVNVLSVGGAGQTPRPDSLDTLKACPAWLIAFDHDANRAGDRGARRIADLSRHKARRALLPDGNDLTDFHKSGGDLKAWLASEFGRFGWPWPPVAVASDPDAWRWRAANLPVEQWKAWRRRTDELIDVDGLVDPEARVEEIHAAELQALAEVLSMIHP